MENQSLYDRRAALYDAIYHFKRYDAEAERLREMLGQRGVGDGSRVLDVACGTGSHLDQLRRWYDVSGLDLNEGMLAIARQKLPDVSLELGDMADFTVERPRDAVLCLFSSIGYLLTREQLEAAARCFAAALRPGGVLVVEPFIEPEEYVEGRIMLQTHDGEELKCARACVSQLDGEHAVLDFNWLVLRSGQPEVEHFVERHRLWLCPGALIAETLEQAGFAVELEPRGLIPDRNVLVGTRS